MINHHLVGPIAASAVTLLFTIDLCWGDDRVWLEPQRPTSTQSDWYPRAIEVVTGKVVGFDAQQLRIVGEGTQQEMVVAAARVLWVQPKNTSPLEAEAMQLFNDGKYSESLSRLPEILKARPPVWRQQWFTMLASVAAWRSGRSKIALELVSQLDRRPLPPVALAWLPIAWENRRQPADAVSAAQDRLSDPSPAVQLVAASWLLSTPQRNQASEILVSLKSQRRTEIADLAEILLWRTAAPPQVIQQADVWEQDLNALPMVLQTGPTKTLADKLNAAGQSARARRLRWAIELVPIHPHP